MSRAHSYTHSRAHSPTFPSLHQRHSSFSNPSVALSTSQLILQPFRCYTDVITHSPTLLSLFLRHRLSNPSVALPTSQLILQPFRCYTNVTAHSPTLLSFSYVTRSSLTSPGQPPMIHNIIDDFFYSCYMSRQQSVNIFLKPRVLVVIPWLVTYRPFENKRGKILFTHQTDYNAFNFYPGTRRMSFVFVLSLVVSGGAPDVLTHIHGGPPLCICQVF